MLLETSITEIYNSVNKCNGTSNTTLVAAAAATNVNIPHGQMILSGIENADDISNSTHNISTRSSRRDPNWLPLTKLLIQGQVLCYGCNVSAPFFDDNEMDFAELLAVLDTTIDTIFQDGRKFTR